MQRAVLISCPLGALSWGLFVVLTGQWANGELGHYPIIAGALATLAGGGAFAGAAIRLRPRAGAALATVAMSTALSLPWIEQPLAISSSEWAAIAGTAVALSSAGWTAVFAAFQRAPSAVPLSVAGLVTGVAAPFAASAAGWADPPLGGVAFAMALIATLWAIFTPRAAITTEETAPATVRPIASAASGGAAVGAALAGSVQFATEAVGPLSPSSAILPCLIAAAALGAFAADRAKTPHMLLPGLAALAVALLGIFAADLAEAVGPLLTSRTAVVGLATAISVPLATAGVSVASRSAVFLGASRALAAAAAAFTLTMALASLAIGWMPTGGGLLAAGAALVVLGAPSRGMTVARFGLVAVAAIGAMAWPREQLAMGALGIPDSARPGATLTKNLIERVETFQYGLSTGWRLHTKRDRVFANFGGRGMSELRDGATAKGDAALLVAASLSEKKERALFLGHTGGDAPVAASSAFKEIVLADPVGTYPLRTDAAVDVAVTPWLWTLYRNSPLDAVVNVGTDSGYPAPRAATHPELLDTVRKALADGGVYVTTVASAEASARLKAKFDECRFFPLGKAEIAGCGRKVQHGAFELAAVSERLRAAGYDGDLARFTNQLEGGTRQSVAESASACLARARLGAPDRCFISVLEATCGEAAASFVRSMAIADIARSPRDAINKARLLTAEGHGGKANEILTSIARNPSTSSWLSGIALAEAKSAGTMPSDELHELVRRAAQEKGVWIIMPFENPRPSSHSGSLEIRECSQ